MTPAIALLILGAILVRAGWKNQSVVDAALGRDTTRSQGNVPTVTPATTGGGSGYSGGGVSDGSLEAEANRMIALRQPYKWGGGHARFDGDGPWDCSGAVSWLMYHLGLLEADRPLVSTEFMAQGKAGRGDYFTIYANPTHVFIKMEAGPRKGQCWGTTRRLASQGGSLRWHQHTTVGFVPRHYPTNSGVSNARHIDADPIPGNRPNSPRGRLP